jgi:aminopeptidase YwaD
MEQEALIERAQGYLDTLCTEISTRRVGSKGNRKATDYVAEKLKAWGFHVEQPEFDCIDWQHRGATLKIGQESFSVQPSPYSLGCSVNAPLVVVSNLAELEQVEAEGKVLLVLGELAKEQLMPKNFPFFNPDEHKKIVALLEAKNPVAILSATGRNPSLAGGLYPFPLIEDGDFDIPSVYMTEEEGFRLSVFAGKMAMLKSETVRTPSSGCNVIGLKGKPGRRIVVTAHIDAKLGTPGAVDNATGVIVLLLLAELLEGYHDAPRLEIAVLNGEDYYDASGEKLYVEGNAGRFGEMQLAINIDGAGFKHGPSAYSSYECPAELEGLLSKVFSSYNDLVPGEAWYQSDHSIFIQNGVPAIALTSQDFAELTTYITHTPKDNPEIVEPSRLVEIALALRDLIVEIGEASYR